MPILDPRRTLPGVLLATCLLASASHANAEEVVTPDILVNTENAVFLDDGRYFVAGSAGIHEIKRAEDTHPSCHRDPAADLTVCTIMPAELNGETCLYSGMTTDGERLYAACSIVDEDLLNAQSPPTAAALVRVEPDTNGYHLIDVTYFAEPVWYNGMAMLDDHTLLMSRSASGSLMAQPGAAIDRIEISDEATLALQVEPWLDASLFYLLPNGIRVDGRYVYFIGGQNVFRIRIRRGGSAGAPILLYQAGLTQVLDDLVIVNDELAIAEISLLGFNSITFVKKTGSLFPRRISTGQTTLSSLAVDPGTLFAPGDLIGTAFYGGGIHRFELP